jgi:NAD+ kinase
MNDDVTRRATWCRSPLFGCRMSENVLTSTAVRYAFRNIALFARSTEAQVVRCMLHLGTHLSGQGLRVLISPNVQVAFPAGATVACDEEDFAQKADLLIAIGGDGTLLRAAHLVAGLSIPLIGINQGRLGFLTDISPSSMRDDVDRILGGSYIEDRRTVLEARIERKGGDDLQGLTSMMSWCRKPGSHP